MKRNLARVVLAAIAALTFAAAVTDTGTGTQLGLSPAAGAAAFGLVAGFALSIASRRLTGHRSQGPIGLLGFLLMGVASVVVPRAVGYGHAGLVLMAFGSGLVLACSIYPPQSKNVV